MTDPRHLTDEEERQSAAEGARLRELMTNTSDPPAGLLDELWPGIRSRIEQTKVVSMESPAEPARRPTRLGGRRTIWIASSIAATILVVALIQGGRRAKSATLDQTGLHNPPGAIVTPVADSAQAYEQEAAFLLNEMEMRRAMLPPRTAASFDHDLRVIDQAIAELKDAIVRDPNNPALRRLLASSYKQKVDLLKRVATTG